MGLNEKQRSSIAKYSYDLSKIVFTFSVVSEIIAGKKFKLWIFISGVILTVLFFVFGLMMEREV